MNRTIFGLALIILAPLLTGAKPSARPELPDDSAPGIEIVTRPRNSKNKQYAT